MTPAIGGYDPETRLGKAFCNPRGEPVALGAGHEAMQQEDRATLAQFMPDQAGAVGGGEGVGVGVKVQAFISEQRLGARGGVSKAPPCPLTDFPL